MNREEIKHLGTLSRLALTESEIDTFSQEIDSILEYVGTVSAMVGEGGLEKVVGARHSVMRTDEVTVMPGSFTETLLSAAPAREGAYVKVKKILDQGE